MMSNLSMFEKLISIQKIYDDIYFKKIRDYNINNSAHWSNHYPHHLEWIEKAYRDLADGNRIAFGAFNSAFGKNDLFGSVLLKKSNYTPELELKNLIIFDTDLKEFLGDDKATLLACSNLIACNLIAKVIAYAGFRGFRRISAELSQKNFILKAFIDSGFTISGTKTPKYFDKDEIIYLNYEVDSLYRLDPYDNIGAAKWIIRMNLRSGEFENRNEVIKLNGITTNLESYIFNNSQHQQNDPILSKFVIKNKVLVVPESFEWEFNGNKIDEINLSNDSVSKFFIFDFTVKKLGDRIQMLLNFPTIVFCRNELFSLLGGSFNSRYRFEYSNVGGLLLISDPNKFPFDKALKANDFFTYIKLGTYGQYVQEGKTILFAHFAYEKDENFRIWGAATLQQIPEFVDINQKRKTLTESKEPGAASMFDADVLWFDEVQDGSRKFNPLWEKKDFSIHNAYNETNHVMLLNLSDFKDLRESSPLFVKDIINNDSVVVSLKNEYEEDYLSDNEVKRFNNLLSSSSKSRTHDASRNFQMSIHSVEQRILFASANAKNTSRLRVEEEARDIEEGLKRSANRDKIYFKQIHATRITDFSRAILDFNPTIIHFSGHGEENGILMEDENGDYKLVSGVALSQLFELFKDQVNCVVLNSCFSKSQAESIADNIGHVIGMNNTIQDSTAVKFATAFYDALGAGREIEFAFKYAKTNIGLHSMVDESVPVLIKRE